MSKQCSETLFLKDQGKQAVSAFDAMVTVTSSLHCMTKLTGCDVMLRCDE